ncbi:MAG: oligoendopeptidase F [Firmicutes bacterium HGW-Firmicutes-11]|nr:MAG: oligoendopeptidase F [Firmicutes bacterium HGW-Firmicutes-11]
MKKVRSKKRNAIDPRYLWNIEAMYQSDMDWEEDLKKAEAMAEEFIVFSGKLGETKDMLLSAFLSKDLLWKVVERVYVYAKMKKDEDTRVGKYQALSDKAQSLIAKASASTSFFVPELLEIPDDTLAEFLENCEELQIYRHVIQQIQREKAHVLSKPEEKLVARYSELSRVTNDIFSMINNADMKFGSIEDESGEQVELTHGTYTRFLESDDRSVRKAAFETMYRAYEARKNTLAATYNYNTKTDVINSSVRKYSSSLEAALSSDNIPVSVYDNLISSVHKHLPVLHRYVDLRKRTLQLSEVHMYDIYAPLVKSPKGDIPYEKALELVAQGLTPLGDTYCRDLNDGFASRWIDVFETEGKTSGAYSFGSYDSMPYVLLNYNGRLKDVLTIAHEMGHSMHSFYTRKAQPFVYGGHSIFTAEVASTVNENLLMHHMIEKEIDKTRKAYLLNLYIEEFRATVFRQTMFAEFERMTHEAVEAGEGLTADWLCDTYYKLNQSYFGDGMVCDPEIAYEWARIPHFYNAFYVYKYATGFSAAVALSTQLLRETEGARDAYLNFLSSGESDDPIPLLKLAGVDMSSPEPVDTAMKVFQTLVEELEATI